MSWMREVLSAALHFFYPEVCLVCERPLPPSEKFVCHTCERDLDAFSLPNESTNEMMRRLMANFPEQTAIDDAIALYRFYKGGKIQAVIHAFKYDGLSSVAVEYGKKLGAKILAERAGVRYDGVAFMPLHPLRQIERGYNQAERLAQGVAEAIGVPVLNCIVRTRYTTTQTGLDFAEREKNMRDAFQATIDLSAKQLILVDDVFTTGSTMLACAKALRKANLSHLTIATLAVTAS